MEKLGADLVAHRMRGEWGALGPAQVDDFVQALAHGTDAVVDGSLIGRVVGTQRIEHKGKPIADAWKVELSDGQNIFAKHYTPRNRAQTTEDNYVPPATKQRLRAKTRATLTRLRLDASDVSRLASYYEALLGVEKKVTDKGVLVGSIEIVQGAAGAPRPGAAVLILETTNFDDVFARVVRAGGRELALSGDASETKWGHFADPEGNVAEITELPLESRAASNSRVG